MGIGPVNPMRMRLPGLSSGLDTESIIRDLMFVEKNKVSKIYRNQKTSTWKLEAYTKLNEDLSSFSNKYLSVLSKDNIISSNAYNSYKTNYKENSAFKVTAGGGTIPKDYNVSEVQMADYGKIEGSELKDVSRTMKVEDLAKQGSITLIGDKLKFKVNGNEFEFKKDDTIGTVMDTVNSQSKDAKMYFSELTKTFSFQTTATGEKAEVTVENGKIFGLKDDSVLKANGKDASIIINGKTVTNSSNSFTVDGLAFEITGNYKANGTSDKGYDITLTKNNDDVVGKVKAFIEDYNKLIDDLYGKLKEKKNHKFYPLTEEEIEAMDNDKDVEKWEEKAKSGLLRNDPVITNLLGELRNAAYAIVGDTGMMAADIGITTNGREGKLSFDEEKFKAALADNPDKVAKVMAGRSKATDKTQEYAESGFVARLNITLSKTRSGLRSTQIQDETNKIYKFEEKIKEVEKDLLRKEEALWAKYTRLEKLMANMNGQSNWIASQLGAM